VLPILALVFATVGVSGCSSSESAPTPAAGGGVTTISGTVVAGGDTTPEGLEDAPRTFVYSVETDEGSTIDVVYTAFLPSPAGDREAEEVTLTFHAGEIRIGDYLVARGTYLADSNQLIVGEAGDYIETFAEKP
jgi:hypothetical protein